VTFQGPFPNCDSFDGFSLFFSHDLALPKIYLLKPCSYGPGRSVCPFHLPPPPPSSPSFSIYDSGLVQKRVRLQRREVFLLLLSPQVLPLHSKSVSPPSGQAFQGWVDGLLSTLPTPTFSHSFFFPTTILPSFCPDMTILKSAEAPSLL